MRQEPANTPGRMLGPSLERLRDRCRGLGTASDAGTGASGRPSGEAVNGLNHAGLPFPVPGGKPQPRKSDGSLPRVS